MRAVQYFFLMPGIGFVYGEKGTSVSLADS
jgi:hypothetical protein